MGIALGVYMLWENKRRDRSQTDAGLRFDEHEGQRLSLLDRTEFVSIVPGSACNSPLIERVQENPHFRYSLVSDVCCFNFKFIEP